MRRRPPLVTMTAALVMVCVLGSGTAHAAGLLSAEIQRTAVLLDGGAAVRVTVSVSCPRGAEALEAFVYVTQRNGDTSEFAGLPVVCDGTTHRHAVAVPALDDPFEKGKARASAYVLLTTGESVSPTRIVNIKKR